MNFQCFLLFMESTGLLGPSGYCGQQTIRPRHWAEVAAGINLRSDLRMKVIP